MNEPIILDERRMIEILGGKECICGAYKGRKMSHCRGCYFALPPEKKSSLYRRMGEGYEEAYMDSLEYLKSINRLQGEFVYDGGDA